AGGRVVALGASTGGPAALVSVLGAFEGAPPCSLVVSQHMPEGFTNSFAQRLDRQTAFSAREARDGDPIQPGLVLVAPGGQHLEFEEVSGQTRARLLPGRSSDRYAPSIDRMFASAAKHFGTRLTAVLLTGMGDDGAEGTCAVSHAGGTVVAESEKTAVVFGMPQQAIRRGVVDFVLPLGEIAGVIAGEPGASAAAGCPPSSEDWKECQ
ncbi:MAG: CheB methylesterase domain-containing protein, partial [Myxococcota bacterium]